LIRERAQFLARLHGAADTMAAVRGGTGIRMRAAVLTTACVLAVLVVWSNLRRTERSAQDAPVAAATASDAPADVAAPPPLAAQPAPTADATGDSEGTAYRPATSEPQREHLVRAGETLASLAERYYGDAARAPEIYAANRDRIRDPSQLHPGQTLVIP
jgi:nucleoid-associated protein YgaU